MAGCDPLLRSGERLAFDVRDDAEDRLDQRNRLEDLVLKVAKAPLAAPIVIVH